ncbi:MAG: glycolate oxidase subunit GlcF [Spiribacter sp.]|jgi:glycolate oxidase iron-sulfur subunit|nr:glycolate oxidase subunit GlcF [Spiribacter sp.]MDR9489731.1 glycolate oxidase subunit GlcF [Spiribacter sp.]
MQTYLADFIKDTPAGQEADAILRKCTHCGFCLANCPTYRLLGDELDSPRGRIYQIKQVLEGEAATESVQLHLDRCLTCRACETTCPSGVEYGRLVDLGREIVDQNVPRPALQGWLRSALRGLLPRPKLFASLLAMGRLTRPFVPAVLRKKIRPRRRPPAWPQNAAHARFVLMLEGCVQPALEPPINPQTARLLDELEISVKRTSEVGCCGAIDQHLGAPAKARARIRSNIDAWWPHIEAGAEAIVVNASGCGAQVKDYAHLLSDDPIYAAKAERVSALAVDPIELLERYADQLMPAANAPRRIAFQTPCTLQHAQPLNGRVDALLKHIGFELTVVPDSHICCGSAGTYSVLQPALAERLREQKLDNLSSGSPELIATANIGCLVHLDEASSIPVRHWLELIQAA